MIKGLKTIWKIIKFLLKVLGIIILVLVVIFTLKYLTAPVYIFPEPQPFSGDQLFNPYEGIDSNYWRKGNFQIQSEAWFGITDGRKNTNEAIDSVYNLLDYDVITISDYQKINRYGEEKDAYIPVYEHGYGVYKNHHVMIGAETVVWKDYPIIHTLQHKQHMMNALRSTSELVYIAHPKLSGGWVADDMKWISNYDGIEVLNGFRESFPHWDTALSSGKNMRILANDDAHDISNINELGRYATLIYSPVLHGDSVVSAMKKGRAFGASIWRQWGEPWDVKVEKAHNLPKLANVELRGDTLMVAVNKTAAQFRFVGQGGALLDSVVNAKEATYHVRNEDTYVRTEIHFPNATAYYLNPVIRYDGGDPWAHEMARVDHLRTWVLRIVGFATLIFIILNIYYLRKRFCKRSNR